MTAFLILLLLLATASLLSIAKADPITPTTAAIEAAKERYETLRVAYETTTDCPETWGPFPTSPSDSVDIAPEDYKKAKLCKCGFLYDQAKSHIVTEAEITAGLAIDGVIPSAETTSEAMETVQSWVLAREPSSDKKCKDGMAGSYPCKDVDLLDHLPMDNESEEANDVWGWTHGNREFVIWGVMGGHYFVEVTGGTIVVLGYLENPSGVPRTYWHDVKVIGDYAYMVADFAGNHGMQVFDLKKLLDVDPDTDCDNSMYCQTFDEDAWYRGTTSHPVGRSHNVVANEDSNTIFIVGAGSGRGLHMVDVSEPTDPTFAGVYNGDGYTHDAQCLFYDGPDSNYKGKEICFCYNEDTVTIVDVTNKSNPIQISRTAYEDNPYTHQGWLSTDQSYIVFGDEGDEEWGYTDKTRTLVLDVSDLGNPTNFREFLGRTAAIDHNQYTKKIQGADYIFQGNYAAGLQIYKVKDYATANFKEVAYFDTYPKNDNNIYKGVWSIYPYLPSEIVVLSSINEGLFLVKPKLGKQCSKNDKPKEFKLESGKTMECSDLSDMKPSKAKKKCKKLVKGGKKKVLKLCPVSCGKVGLGKCKFLKE